jgi:hypothetical protein
VKAEAVADLDLEPLVRKDHEVDAAEGDGLRARWEFGRMLLSMRSGKRLPNGVLEQLAEETGKSRAELKFRMQFAARYELAKALASFNCWWDVIQSFSKGTAEHIVSSESNEWYTPAKYIQAAREVMGGIDLDPASCKAANKVVEAKRFYDKQADGLNQPWSGRVWLNPPYGGIAAEFVARLVAEYEAGNITAGIALVNAHCTDTNWFQLLWSHALCFTDHRIDFTSTDAKDSTSTHGSVFAYLGKKPESFAERFREWGAIVRAWRPWEE